MTGIGAGWLKKKNTKFLKKQKFSNLFVLKWIKTNCTFEQCVKVLDRKKARDWL